MAEHYFSDNPTSIHKETTFSQVLKGREYTFTTDAGVFSKDKVDLGTRILIDALTVKGDEFALDWGCGYGPIGVVLAAMLPGGRVLMVDINPRAAELSKKNLAGNGIKNAEVRVGNGFDAIPEVDLDLIVSNPPIRAGKQVIYPMVDEAAGHLKSGGRLVMVAKTNQGVKSLAKKMEEVFGNVRELEKGSGFRVIESMKE